MISCNRAGTPDILACVRGRFVALEVKTPTGRLAPIQEHQLARIKEAGGVVAVVRSLDEVRSVLDTNLK